MALEDGMWIMQGPDWDDPGRIRTWQELITYIDEVGFLPLFANEVPGFSVEEHVSPDSWWTGIEEEDPWEWRVLIARSGRAAYGKFFEGKSGFVSLKWFPIFANYRRDGYDFDARFEDELASNRQKKIMDRFEEQAEWIGMTLRKAAGFGRGGEKNFSGIVSTLQMETYLVIKDFRRKVNKRGGEYGMPVSVYVKPEDLWGRDMVTAAYKEDPAVSGQKIRDQLAKNWPQITEKQLDKIMG